MASDTAASSASKLQAAADSTPAATAAQNPALQSIAAPIETPVSATNTRTRMARIRPAAATAAAAATPRQRLNS
jgi:hypothetical protein